MKEFDPRTVVIIPAYNEGRIIADVVQGIRAVCPFVDVVVVDDGSRDETRSRAAGAGARVISHPYNLGYGAALQTGYQYALAKGYQELVQMDGDGQHDPSFISSLVAPVRNGEVDVAIGSRFLTPEGTENEASRYHAGLVRRLGMTFFGTIASLLIRQKVTDPTSGFQAMNRKVLAWLSGDRFPFDYPDADVIIMLHRGGYRIAEVPVRMFENRDKKSMHSGWKPLYYVFKMFLSIFVTLMRKQDR